jgi:hypothetical protein
MAAQARFCGNCGSPLAPGAPFCGRCGAPAGVPAAVAYPGYSYPQAAPARSRLGPQIAVAGLLVGILLVVTIAVTAFAIRQNTDTHKNCTANCAPPIVKPLPAPATYKSSAFKFEVDYSPRWTVRSQNSSGITLGTALGEVSVIGAATTSAPDQVMQGVVAALPTATFQGVTRVMDLKGAHMGDQNGVGAIYAASMVNSNSKAVKIRFAVIVAAKNGVAVVMFALNAEDTANFASGMPEGQLFDYMCTEFRWGS